MFVESSFGCELDSMVSICHEHLFVILSAAGHLF
jgi:hypothetical protein